MDQTYEALGQSLLDRLQTTPADERLIVAIAGIPGSAKSTLSAQVCARINARAGKEVALVVPMDGFHFSKAALDLLPDPASAHARRGAAFTFDPFTLLELVQDLRQVPPRHLTAPSFDHAVGDPVQDDIRILPSNRIILIEGLYLHVSEKPWSDIYALCDESWFMQCELEAAAKRVVSRHVLSGLASTIDAARQRWESNDLKNAQFVLTHRLPATREITSI